MYSNQRKKQQSTLPIINNRLVSETGKRKSFAPPPCCCCCCCCFLFWYAIVRTKWTTFRKSDTVVVSGNTNDMENDSSNRQTATIITTRMEDERHVRCKVLMMTLVGWRRECCWLGMTWFWLVALYCWNSVTSRFLGCHAFHSSVANIIELH